MAKGGKNGRAKKKREDSFFCRVQDAFHFFAQTLANALGTPWAFGIAFLIIVIWAVSGPAFGFSDTWQLVINTGTTIITFLMVFLIQNTQNRDAKAMHLKLDELIRATGGARDNLVDLEKMSDEELKKIENEFEQLHQMAGNRAEQISKARSARKT